MAGVDLTELVVVVEQLGYVLRAGAVRAPAVNALLTGAASGSPSSSIPRNRPCSRRHERGRLCAGGRPRSNSILPVRRSPPLADPRVRDTLAVVLSAEAVGIARGASTPRPRYAKVREQFGAAHRPVPKGEARCRHARALELARAATWDAGRELTPLTEAVATSLAVDAAVLCANGCIQVLGGIGFTWEHDAHLYLKRALSIEALLGGAGVWRREVAQRALAGERRQLRLDLGPDAEPYRDEVRAFIATLEKGQRRAQMAEAGYIAPHWPKPWGRDASPVEQLVIDQEFAAAGVGRPHLAVGAWALPTIIEHGTAQQQERFIAPTLRGELNWCQLFSEPGAGSDLAALTMKAVRGEGGWLLSGQKVWTSMAQSAEWGICLARTDSDRPKHEASLLLVDMSRRRRRAAAARAHGASLFNEVFCPTCSSPTTAWWARSTTGACGSDHVGQRAGIDGRRRRNRAECRRGAEACAG